MIDLKGEIGELKTALVETGVDVGPVIYLARTFETDIDTVVKFFYLYSYICVRSYGGYVCDKL